MRFSFFPSNILRILLAVTLLTGPASGQDSKAPLSVGVFTIPPFSDISRDGEQTGFLIELATEIASEVGVDVEFVRMSSSAELIQAQINGDTHIIAGIARLPPLEATNIFTQSVATEPLRMIVLSERASELAPQTLSNSRIGIVPPSIGSGENAILDKNIPVSFDAPEAAVVALLKGDVDALLIPAPVAFDVTKRARLDDRVTFLTPDIRTFDRFVALHESRADLLDDVTRAIDTLEADGRLDTLRRKYFIELPPPAPQVLTVGVYHFPPYQIVSEYGQFSGFSVETLRDLAKRSALSLEFKEISLEEWRTGPSPDSYDLLPPVGINAERESRMDFAMASDELTFSIFVQPGNPHRVQNLDDLAGLKVGVQPANLSYRLVKDREEFTLIRADNPQALYDGLLGGDTDAILYPTQAVRKAAMAGRFEDQIEEIAPAFFTARRGTALRFGLGDIRERLNSVTPNYLISDEYAALERQFFGQPVFWTSDRRLLFSIIAGVLTLAMGGAAAFAHVRARTGLDAERALRITKVTEIKDELETILNAATSGIVALDQSGRIVRINKRARHMLGGISNELPFNWPEHIKFLDGESLAPLHASADPIRRALSGHRLRSETHLLNKTHEGDAQRYVRVSSAFLEHDSHGIAVVLVVDDVSNEERNRQAVERKNRLDALGQLTGGIAHDFNNLLASLLYAIDLAKSAKDDTARDRYMNVALASVVRGRDLTHRLLAFAKRQPGLATSKTISDVFTDFEQLIRPMIEETVEINLQAETGRLQVFCDQTQLETALMNLVLNSRDAILRSGKGNNIEIKARAVGLARDLPDVGQRGLTDAAGTATDNTAFRYVEISVSDNGPGMDDETLARSTDPFFTTKDTNSGTGLGLSMVYGFVRQSDGEIRLYSEEDVGTTIQITLPRGTEAGLREPPVLQELPKKGNGEVILLVEDEQDLLIVMSSVLEDLGYKVITAKTGDEAFEMITSDLVFDLLLTDVVMPGGLGGFQLAKRVRQILPDVPVIYTSGYTGFTSSEMGDVQAPLLQKPTPPVELAEAIHEALSGQTREDV